MAENTEVLNQNEHHQDMDGVARANFGALHDLAKQGNAGTDITKLGPNGGDNFNLLTDMALDVVGGNLFSAAVSVADDLYSSNSKFTNVIGGGNKRSRQHENLKSMNDAMGLPKSYSQKIEDANKLSRIRAGRANTKNPLLQGSTGVDFMGNKIKKEKPVYLTWQMLQQNPHKFGPAVKKHTDNIDQAKHAKDNPTSNSIIIGVQHDHADALKRAETMKVDDIAQATKGLAEDKREKIIERVTSPDQFARPLLSMDDLKPKSPDSFSVSLKKKPLNAQQPAL